MGRISNAFLFKHGTTSVCVNGNDIVAGKGQVYVTTLNLSLNAESVKIVTMHHLILIAHGEQTLSNDSTRI